MPTFSPSQRSSPIVAHDPISFRAALVTLVPDLRGRALRLAGDRALADDLVQDTVERALRFQAQYERGTNLRAWAFQVLFSIFVTRYRRTRRERNALKNLSADPCAWTNPDGLERPETAVSLTKRTRHHLEELPEGFRTVVCLIDIEERSYRDAASELGVPIGTVMSRLHRGRKLLASRLAEAA